MMCIVAYFVVGYIGQLGYLVKTMIKVSITQKWFWCFTNWIEISILKNENEGMFFI